MSGLRRSRPDDGPSNESHRQPKTLSSGTGLSRGVFRPRQTRQLPRAVDLKGRLLSCQSY